LRVVLRGCQKAYKYMRIYLWTALRNTLRITLRIRVFVQGKQDNKAIFCFSMSDLVGRIGKTEKEKLWHGMIIFLELL
jgi:hypothetical protein